MKQVKLTLCMFISLLLITACAAPTPEEKALAERPDWIDNAQGKYPSNDYLTAVGQASNRTRAGQSAVTNLLEIFSVKVRAETKTLTEAVKQESVVGVTLESSTTLQRSIETETDQVIQGVEIKESWLSPTGDYYALAVLEKNSAAQNLMQSITELDNKTAELIDYSINFAPNSILAVNALRSARDQQLARKTADLQLKYISGSGVPNNISSNKIEQLISRKLASLQMSVKADSDSQKKSLQAGLAKLGVKVVNESSLQLSAEIDVTDPAFINNWYWLRGSYELTISENDKVISRKRWTVKISAKQKELLNLRLQDKLNSQISNYLQQLVSDTPTL
ncbi:hypothetical protein E2R68_02840 [Psychromonas sp. RZ22]|uniref:LPP20 family lipoprotein n=1 Tax=Psychromonas algarum TaxID=2555643 RepID=UPI001068CDAB|nr:LPP20 family lipoprotein [Psychromonas sp. RZ22]TEW56043.1 hypothetical protein E2R68_02840 [Psychromonas sp. RZ22]